MTTSFISEKLARSQLLETRHPKSMRWRIPRYTAQETWQTTKNGKITKMLTICHRQNELHSIFSSKVRDCYRYDNNDLYMKLIPQNCTFQIRAPQVIWVSTSKVMTSSVKNEHVLELVSRVVASARKRGLADDGILSPWCGSSVSPGAEQFLWIFFVIINCSESCSKLRSYQVSLYIMQWGWITEMLGKIGSGNELMTVNR